MFILVLVFIFLLRNELPFLETISNYASLFILIIGFVVIFLWWSNSLFNSLNKEIKQLYRFWIIMIFWFAFVPVFFHQVNFNIGLFYEGMYHDYRYMLFSILPFMFITNTSQKYFQSIFNNTAKLGVLCGFVAILLVDKSFSSISERTDGFSLPYYLWWIVLLVYPYMFLRSTFITKDRIGIILLILHLILSIFFLKRSGFVNAGIIIILSIYFSGNKSKGLKVLFVTFFLFVALVLGFGSYMDLLFDRFGKDSSNLEEWDRSLEIVTFFETISNFHLFTGYGMNNYLKMTYIGELDKGVNSLHIGFFNLLYKGGFLYVLFVTFLAYNIFKLYRYISVNPEIKIGFILGLVYIIGHFYENGWSYVPIHFFSLLPIFRAIYLRRQYIDNQQLQLTIK